jgi:hypothetical protein
VPTVTVLVPTYKHGPTLYDSIATALAQTYQDFEILIVGDGVEDTTRAVVADLQRGDGRIRFFDYPKGERRGERNRHEALKEARGHLICYLADDDVWFPEHLSVLVGLLEHADFAHTLPVKTLNDGSYWVYLCDLRHRYYQRLMAGNRNLLPMTCVGHRLSTYWRLPEGWIPEDGTRTSVVLWRQFMGLADCRFASSMMPTTLHLASTIRGTRPSPEWLDELRTWRRRVEDREWRQQAVADLFEQEMRDFCAVEAKLRSVWKKQSTADRPPIEAAGDPTG